MGFTKLDSEIIDSSLWDEHSDVLKVFEAFWTKSDPDGIVNATYNAMFRAANLCDRSKKPLPIEDFDFALNVLLSPDPNSRTKKHDGRRIVRLEESKWLIVTYKERREYTYSNNPEAIRKREYRNGTLRDVSQSVPGHSASVSASDSSLLKEDHKRKTFIKPTLEEVKQYCIERKNGIDPQSFIDFYESKGWMIGKSPMKNWQAAVRTWEKNRQSNKQETPEEQNLRIFNEVTSGLKQ